MLRDAYRRYRNSDGAPGGGTPPAPAAGTGTQNPSANTLAYDQWFAGLDAAHQELVNAHVRGLKTTAESERTMRKDFEKKAKDLAAAAEKGSEMEKQVGSLLAQLSEANQRAEFLAGAQAAGCSNSHLAFLAAREGGHFDQNGKPNWEAIKGAFPELFATQQPAPGGSGDAGSGTQQTPAAGDMNSMIRKAAGIE